MTKRIGTRAICATCDLEIEYHGKGQWLDRGGNTSCAASGTKHTVSTLTAHGYAYAGYDRSQQIHVLR